MTGLFDDLSRTSWYRRLYLYAFRNFMA